MPEKTSYWVLANPPPLALGRGTSRENGLHDRMRKNELYFCFTHAMQLYIVYCESLLKECMLK
jgi:hypothetical protein